MHKKNDMIYITMGVFYTSMTRFLVICKFNVIKASTQKRIHAYSRMKLQGLHHHHQSGWICYQQTDLEVNIYFYMYIPKCVWEFFLGMTLPNLQVGIHSYWLEESLWLRRKVCVMDVRSSSFQSQTHWSLWVITFFQLFQFQHKSF